MDAFGLDIDYSLDMSFANVTRLVVVASVTVAAGLANVTVRQQIRKMMYHDVRLPRCLLKAVHRNRMGQIDLCHRSD